jgi:hypothetical protein
MKTLALSFCALLIGSAAIAETPLSRVIEHTFIGPRLSVLPRPEKPVFPPTSIINKPIVLKLEILPLLTASNAPFIPKSDSPHL